MRLLHVITGMARAAGTSVFCGEALRALSDQGHDCRLWVRRHNPADAYPTGAATVSENPPEADWRPDVVHLHALWTPWLLRPYLWAKRRGIPVVWSPHGMLTEWALAQGTLKKRAALTLYQWHALNGSNLLHATAQSEVDDLRRQRLYGPAVIVPLGATLPSTPPPPYAARENIVLFLSRVHPKKGLFNLVDAWSALRPIGWRLLIAGPSDGDHAEAVLARAHAAGLDEDAVTWLGPVYGPEKDALYARAKLFVLPSFSENFGSVVIEALAAGTPVVTTRATPWEELETHRCGRWIDLGVQPLAEALTDLLAQPDEVLQAMGERGRALVRERYAWPAVARALAAAYETLLERGN